MRGTLTGIEIPTKIKFFNFCCFIIVAITCKLSLKIVSRIRSFEARISLFTDAEA